MAPRDTSFDAAFTTACYRAFMWKTRYGGAGLRTRMVRAIHDLEAAIAAVKSHPEIAEALNREALQKLPKIRDAFERNMP